MGGGRAIGGGEKRAGGEGGREEAEGEGKTNIISVDITHSSSIYLYTQKINVLYKGEARDQEK